MRGEGGASKDEPEHKVTRVDLVSKSGGGGKERGVHVRDYVYMSI